MNKTLVRKMKLKLSRRDRRKNVHIRSCQWEEKKKKQTFADDVFSLYKNRILYWCLRQSSRVLEIENDVLRSLAALVWILLQVRMRVIKSWNGGGRNGNTEEDLSHNVITWMHKLTTIYTYSHWTSFLVYN